MEEVIYIEVTLPFHLISREEYKWTPEQGKMLLHEKWVMNSAFEHGQSLSHISVVDGVGLKKSQIFNSFGIYS